MTYLYIDESGELGIGTNGSKYFILTCVKIDDEKTNELFKRIPKKVRERPLIKKLRRTSELKFSNCPPITRDIYLKDASKLDIKVYSVIIEKKFTDDRLKEKIPVLYNYLINILLEKSLIHLDKNKKLNIILDRCMSKNQMETFESYIQTKFFTFFNDLPDVKITHENSEQNGGLQVTDFICGAFGYKYNSSKLVEECERYTQIFKNRIILEKNNLFKEK